jgi:2',3'-cyclic-nucleotide 2'-phosphodiesterase / 3'-nucleotidase / 5'-nucleotidase
MNIVRKIIVLALVMSLVLPASVMAIETNSPAASTANTVNFTILHINDFHGNLEPAGSNPGMARTSYAINEVRNDVGEENVLLVDAGDFMQGSLLSNLQKGAPTVAVYNFMGFDLTTLGNHEFDWGQDILAERHAEADFPFLSANIVVNDTGNCETAGWTSPDFATPYITATIGTAPDEVVVGFIGATSVETPYITIAEATEGLCFKDPAESVIHYYDEISAEADFLVVMSHLGLNDGGYGYGIQVYGDITLAGMLNDAGKPVHMVIGGHSHTAMDEATIVDETYVVQAHHSGRRVGRADVEFDLVSGTPTITWAPIIVSTTGDEDPDVKDLVDAYATDPDYLELVNREIGYTNVALIRNYNDDSLMGKFIQDALYGDLNNDGEPLNDVDMVFNNPGGIRIDIDPTEFPHKLTYGQMFSILPFGNQTIVGDMTGAQIVELLNQSATLFRGALQVAGVRYKFYRYGAGSTYWAWGAFDIEVKDRDTGEWGPIELDKVYRVGTNEFLAPAGQDGFIPFKYMTNISYWGDMLDGVNRWVEEHYTIDNPYDETLDGRIERLGDNDGGPVVPVTILHNNDSHGYLDNYAKLATLIKEKKDINPRTLLLNGGDQIQGDAMMYYFKSAPLGYAADGTALPVELQDHPLIAVMNHLEYDAMVVGNHEYNFGKEIFTSVLGQAEFPMLQANVEDTGEYGLDLVPVEPYTTFDMDGINVAVLGIGNHRVPSYELPSNIVGLTFSSPIDIALEHVPALRAENDLVIALTHIGFTTDPYSVEVDNNVDTVLAAEVPGIDVIVGGHSHTNPKFGFGEYKWLPTIIGGPENQHVIVSQAARRNLFLGEMVVGFLPDGGGYRLAGQAGRYHEVVTETPADPDVANLIEPYKDLLAAYNAKEIGVTTVPIDALMAHTEETNAANLQADAAVFELASNDIVVDFHLSGAMTNAAIATDATPENPITLKVADMFSLMPYENSLVVMEINGPQLKQILERAYRNYFFYKYIPGRGGYSYYTTCMLDISAGGEIVYNDTYPWYPDGNNVSSLSFDGTVVDFTDAETYYKVSTVNYLAAGACNFSNAGETLWPLDQIIHDTQYYVRDAVINYTEAQDGPIAPAIEDRLVFLSLPYRIFTPIIRVLSEK